MALALTVRAAVEARHAEEMQTLREQLAAVQQREKVLTEALRKVLASAYPNERDHPTMSAAWKEARAALSSSTPSPSEPSPATVCEWRAVSATTPHGYTTFSTACGDLFSRHIHASSTTCGRCGKPLTLTPEPSTQEPSR